MKVEVIKHLMQLKESLLIFNQSQDFPLGREMIVCLVLCILTI